MTNVTESCVFRSCMSFVVGGALGRYSNNRDTISVTGTGKVYSKALWPDQSIIIGFG